MVSEDAMRATFLFRKLKRTRPTVYLLFFFFLLFFFLLLPIRGLNVFLRGLSFCFLLNIAVEKIRGEAYEGICMGGGGGRSGAVPRPGSGFQRATRKWEVGPLYTRARMASGVAGPGRRRQKKDLKKKWKMENGRSPLNFHG